MIRAEVHSDDRVFQATFDATPWFEQATPEDIAALRQCEWGGDYPADEVAQFFDGKDDGVSRVFAYLALDPTMPNGDTVGFECHIMGGDAIMWLRDRGSNVDDDA